MSKVSHLLGQFLSEVVKKTKTKGAEESKGYTVKKRAAKSKKSCKIPQTSETPTAMIKELAAVF